MVRRLKISNLGHHHLSRTIFILYLIETPACELYLVYSVTSFAARTGVNCTLKIFKDKSKSSSNNNSIGVSAEFSKILGERSIPNYLLSKLHRKGYNLIYTLLKGSKLESTFFLLHILGVDQNLGSRIFFTFGFHDWQE